MLPNYEFLEAIKRGTDQEVLTALDNGASLHARDLKRRSALSLCDLYERNDIARILIKRGADLHEQIGPNADTLLHQAIRHGNLAFAKLLLDCGLHPDASNRNGETPLLMAVERDFQYFAKTLLECGAFVNIADRKGDTPLHVAARHGRAGFMKKLINAGADASVVNVAGQSPLDEAVRSGQLDAVTTLLKRCSDTFESEPQLIEGARQKAQKMGDQSILDALDQRRIYFAAIDDHPGFGNSVCPRYSTAAEQYR